MKSKIPIAAKGRLLIVDDEEHIRRVLQASLERDGYQTTLAESAQDGLRALAESQYDLVISDALMPGMSGYEFLSEVRRLHPAPPFILMTAFGTIPQAVQAMRDGAFEYLTKPFDLDQVKKVVASAIRSGAEPERTNKGSETKGAIGWVAESAAMREVFEMVDQIADSRATVMIGGESGVGKEVVAKALHQRSSRSKFPFVAVSCAALPETLLESELFGYEKGAFTGAMADKPGRFEAAQSGTLFLDEIGEIPMPTQVKLLRVLQEREVERLGSNSSRPIDVRVITATHRDLEKAVNDGEFRLDLLYRLKVIEILVPPLRERLEDVLPLARYFLESKSKENNVSKTPRLTTDAEASLLAYSWPGNVRELENVMERACALASNRSDEISSLFLPKTVTKAA